VGPRPNVEREVALYTQKERHLLDLRPGCHSTKSRGSRSELAKLSGAEAYPSGSTGFWDKRKGVPDQKVYELDPRGIYVRKR
jgi:lipopolysaccharide/colanic/teichoic acid biosynthesis glycosyltransferase